MEREIRKIEDLESNIYIPLLDDPVTSGEVNENFKKCKKGGYDIINPVMTFLISSLLPSIVLIFNMMFYVQYPRKLACSLLSSIPKCGDLRFPVNFRGIQMLPSLGVLYDRIIAARINK